MTENQLDALIATISEKAKQADLKAMESEGYLEREFMFSKGQYQAFLEIHTMLTNIKNSQKQ
jgi:hypothetical protein